MFTMLEISIQIEAIYVNKLKQTKKLLTFNDESSNIIELSEKYFEAFTKLWFRTF